MRYEMRPHVDLCSGIGGFALGFIAAQVTEPVLFCDFDEKVRKLLKVRFPGIPIANDVKEIASDPRRFIHERPFILSSGYPCQPFSASGKRRGEEDPRHIFPHIAEIVEQTRPSYCVFENVYGHISLGLDKVLSQMGSLDYSTATFVVPAAGFRPHKRDRLWIICKNMADTNNEGIWTCERGSNVDHERLSGERRADGARSSSNDGWNNIETTKDEGLDVANSKSEGLQRRIQSSTFSSKRYKRSHFGNFCSTEGKTRETFSEFCRIFNGISGWLDEPGHIERTTHKNEHRTERLKQLGNALLPQITYRIGLAIKECEENK
jgi:site-specific DNA-cytosine methylase